MSLQRRSGAGKKEWRDSRGFGFTISPFVYLPWAWSHGLFSLLAFWLAYGLHFGLGGWLLVGQLFGLIQGWRDCCLVASSDCCPGLLSGYSSEWAWSVH
jgi:hypothetical protein